MARDSKHDSSTVPYILSSDHVVWSPEHGGCLREGLVMRTAKLPANAPRVDIERALAKYHARIHPRIYVDADDVIACGAIENFYGKTRKDLALSARCHALMEDE